MAAGSEAVKKLYRSNFDRMVRYTRMRLPNPADAEDVVNDSFLKIWRRANEIEHLPAYAQTALRRELSGRLRSKRPLLGVEGLEERPGDIDLERDSISQDQQAQVIRALADLPPRQQRILRMYAEGLTPAEISKELSSERMNSNQISCTLRRAKENLKKALLERGFVPVFIPFMRRLRLQMERGLRAASEVPVEVALQGALVVVLTMGSLGLGTNSEHTTRSQLPEIAQVVPLEGRMEAAVPNTSGDPMAERARNRPSASPRRTSVLVEVDPVTRLQVREDDGNKKEAPGLDQQVLDAIRDPSRIPLPRCGGLPGCDKLN